MAVRSTRVSKRGDVQLHVLLGSTWTGVMLEDGEAVNAVVVSAQAAALLHVRTPDGPMLVCAPIDPRVLGQMTGLADVVGRAIRLRRVAGGIQVGHIVDVVWRDTL